MTPSADNPRTRALTTLLGSTGGDDRQAPADLLPEVCDELRRVAQVRMAEPPGSVALLGRDPLRLRLTALSSGPLC